MKQLVRLDKYLSEMGVGTRSEVKIVVKKGRVTVNGEVMKKSDCKIDINQDEVVLDGRKIGYVSKEYIMLNKPANTVSATNDNTCQTVIELLLDAKRNDLFPVGRLDKDTEGLLLITNDGSLAHDLLSPKKHVAKTYYAKVEGMVTEEDVRKFSDGLVVDEEFHAKPAQLKILRCGDISEIELTIYEGKFHQVKRMFEAVDKKVIYLKRLSMGPLQLDPTLQVGEYRELTKEELDCLMDATKSKE